VERIGALLIDFGGTLDADGLPWADRFFALYHGAGGEIDRSRFNAAFAAADRLLARLPGVITFDYSATATAQARLLRGLLPDGAETLTDAAALRFARDARQCAARNAPVLRDLKRTWRLGVVSNFQGNLAPCLAELGLDDVFDAVSDSAVVGAEKPDRRIFEATTAALGLSAAACWMVGDSPPNDIAAATALGMRTCWVAPATRPVIGPVPTRRIARFDELPLALAA
jgi:putative hydrolase of the HAD superfamily